MILKQNLNSTDRWLRFALAFWWLSPMAPYFEIPNLNLLVMIVAWIALAEAFVGWCALHQIFGVRHHS
jgi:hypothetical protein